MAVFQVSMGGDSRRTARALRALRWAMDEDNTTERVPLLEEALALAEESDWLGRTSGNTWRRVVTSIHLSRLAVADGELDAAESCFQACGFRAALHD
jgi:hypothetical protein